MTYTYSTTIYDYGNDYIVYRIVKNSQNYISWNEFYYVNAQSPVMIHQIMASLKNCPFEEYYLEFNPVSYNNSEETLFEYVLIKTSGFNSNSNINVFGSKQLNTNSSNIYVFPNISNTSILISPHYNHNYDINTYAHIGSFMKSENLIQQFNLLQKMFMVYKELLNANPQKKFWLSTHGKGVAWLHIRIDSVSKYITWNKYK